MLYVAIYLLIGLIIALYCRAVYNYYPPSILAITLLWAVPFIIILIYLPFMVIEYIYNLIFNR